MGSDYSVNIIKHFGTNMKTMNEIWRKMLKAYSKGKENKAAKLEYKMLKKTLAEKKRVDCE